MSLNRRTVIKGALATGVATSALKVPAAVAQAGPIKVGFLTVKSGALASGGLQMEQGMLTFFKERNNMLAGRPVELQTADTGGNPAQARTKTQELVERFGVHVLIGPLAAFEALAIDDYIKSSKTPILTVAGAEDMTQRKPNPWLVRPSATSSQPSHPMGDYAAKDLKLKRAIAIADDFAFGHENVAGFMRAFEDAGGKVIQKMFTPLNAPDYGTYVSQFKNADCLYTGHAGSNGLKLVRQLAEYGLKGKFTIVGGFTPIDESVLQQMGEDGVGCYSGCWYSASLDNPINKKFVATIQREYKVDPGVYAAETYLCGEVLEHAVKSIGGKIEDKDVFMKALKGAKVPDTLCGPVSFDELGNVVGNIYIRKVEKKDGKYVNTVVKTYPNVSQFWTYNKDEFLKNPVYSRDYPPAKNLE
ncbi:MAG TPA: ABC transporter substrate-binding protein, partial [Xanthobacteraceae bacterium]|nr:ABC transporter substrate-binding protein [Xanthobacteraceae bacterium]